MPRDTSIKSVLVIGSGPIVIGQACEFDYSGTQAIKVLRKEGIRVSLVNSNPATIMTDPEYADRTYVEPLTPEAVEAILERERPDALLPTVGGQTALNLAVELSRRGVLDRLGVRLIGASRRAVEVGEDRQLFKEAMARIGLDVPKSGFATTIEEAREGPRGHRAPGGHPAVVHPGRHRRRRRLQPRGVRGDRRTRHRPVARSPDPDRGVGPRLEGVRARGDAGPGRQLRGDLLDRELRPDGHPHGGLGDRRAGADAHRPRVPADAQRRPRDHPRGGRRDGRVEHPVRGGPEDRAHDGHRDEPARVALLGPREQGDRASRSRRSPRSSRSATTSTRSRTTSRGSPPPRSSR